MWFPKTFTRLADYDVQSLADLVAALPNELWEQYKDEKQYLAPYRDTQSIFFRSIHDPDLVEILSKRPIAEGDISVYQVEPALVEEVRRAVIAAVSYFSPDGIIARVQLAKLNPGTKIKEHCDTSALLTAAHRIHVPVISNPGVAFFIDGDNQSIKPGGIYEINNRLLHSVENNGSTARTHLIIDYLPAVHNQQGFSRDEFYRSEKKRKQQVQVSTPLPQLSLPRIVASSVVRGAQKHQSHGGLFLIDLNTRQSEQVFDWDSGDISFEGRGWDRGLRGIVFYKDYFYVAASDELFCFDQKFNIVNSWRNPFLRHAHEMHVLGETLLVTSTGFDAILGFNLNSQRFEIGWGMGFVKGKLVARRFDPNEANGPLEKNQLHINNVYADSQGIYFCGRKMRNIQLISKDGVRRFASVPLGTHNARPFKGGVLYNDTASDIVAFETDADYCYFDVPHYDETKLLHRDKGDEHVARQAFGRGLAIVDDELLITGSSPSTISVYHLLSKNHDLSMNLSMDVRNAIHGICVVGDND